MEDNPRAEKVQCNEKQKEVGGLTNPLLKKALVLLVAWLGGDLTLWVQCLLIVDQGIRHR